MYTPERLKFISKLKDKKNFYISEITVIKENQMYMTMTNTRKNV